MRPRGRIIVLCVGELPKSGFVPRRRRFPANQCRREEAVVGKRSRFSLVSTLIGAKSRPFISSFGCQVFLSIRFDFAPILWDLVQSSCWDFLHPRAQSENANYFRALFTASDDEKFFVRSVYNVIHTQWWDDIQTARNN